MRSDLGVCKDCTNDCKDVNYFRWKAVFLLLVSMQLTSNVTSVIKLSNHRKLVGPGQTTCKALLYL